MTLTVENGSFSYGKAHKNVINNINFTAESGDLIAVLGPNGAGKTTLLRCIMGFLKWKCGKSMLDGEDIQSISYKKLWQSIAYVPQAKNVSGAYSVRETVLLGRSNRIGIFEKPKSKDIEKTNEIIKKLHIEDISDKKCSEISGGELQMTLIARALVSEPSILILDEPESNLDFRNQLIVLDVMSELANSGMTCIFNTHYPAHALQRANKSLLLNDNGESIFDLTSKVVTEENIEKAFSVNAKIGDIETPYNILKSVVPLSVSEKSDLSELTCKNEKNRSIAVVSIIMKNTDSAEKINLIIHEYNEFLIGRMGLPYRKANVNIINITFDAPQSVIDEFTAKINIIPNLSVKTTFANFENS